MKITFPRLGDSHIYGRLLFRELGVEMVVPAPNGTEALERGAAISLEDICMPFKIMVGNLLSAWDRGADTVVMPATMGPCRLGQYGELLSITLKRQGCDFRWILLDSAKAIGVKELGKRLKEIIVDSDCNSVEIFRALRKTYKLIKCFENLEAQARAGLLNEYGRNPGKDILKSCRKELSQADNLSQAIGLVKSFENELKEAGRSSGRHDRPLKMLLTGEIYTLIDSYGNRHIEDVLMDLGVAFEKRISIGWWIRNTVLNPLGGVMSEAKYNPLLPHRIGGYAKESINDSIMSVKKGFDGIIQVFPVGCMPEIVAKSLLDDLAKMEGIPVLTIIYDEMEGEAGYLTRIEAFVDMLNRKRELGYVLSGNRRRLGKH
jgi:predicted nucleotide-binding protein (sugar kinase/HSP70/actin superfamily)